MSRSYKKVPIMVGQNGKSLKRKANKTVRRYNKELINSLKKNDFNESIDSCKKEISNNKNYKKVYQSYDICDYMFSMTYEQYLNFYDTYPYVDRKGKSDKEMYRAWYTKYKMK